MAKHESAAQQTSKRKKGCEIERRIVEIFQVISEHDAETLGVCVLSDNFFLSVVFSQRGYCVKSSN